MEIRAPRSPGRILRRTTRIRCARWDLLSRAESVQKALEDAKVDRIPNRPNGRHIATDLLAYFYGSADGEDFLYNAAIKRDECRGLDTSTKRPPALT